MKKQFLVESEGDITLTADLVKECLQSKSNMKSELVAVGTSLEVTEVEVSEDETVQDDSNDSPEGLTTDPEAGLGDPITEGEGGPAVA